MESKAKKFLEEVNEANDLPEIDAKGMVKALGKIQDDIHDKIFVDLANTGRKGAADIASKAIQLITKLKNHKELK